MFVQRGLFRALEKEIVDCLHQTVLQRKLFIVESQQVVCSVFIARHMYLQFLAVSRYSPRFS